MLVTEDDIKQFDEEGYFVLEKVISEPDLAGLRIECQKNLDLQIASMDRVGAETLGLSHKENRYTLPCRYEENPSMERFLFGDVMTEISSTTFNCSGTNTTDKPRRALLASCPNPSPIETEIYGTGQYRL